MRHRKSQGGSIFVAVLDQCNIASIQIPTRIVCNFYSHVSLPRAAGGVRPNITRQRRRRASSGSDRMRAISASIAAGSVQRRMTRRTTSS
jgi:hypothetical protein